MVVEGLLKDDGGAVLEGDFQVTISLYAAQGSVDAVWTETLDALTVKGGFFQARLGMANKLEAGLFQQNAGLWIGVALEGQPEFPRTSLETDPYAYRAMSAASADALNCTGCVDQSHVGFNVVAGDGAGAAITAVNALSADVAGDIQCTGCVDLTALDVGVLAAGNVSFDDAAAQLGADNVQSALEKLKVLVDAGGGGGADLPPDALGVISNGLLKNVFNESFTGTDGMAIQDNNPGGVLDEVEVPDVGIVQIITVSVDLTNADIGGLNVTLFDPLNQSYVLHDKTGAGAYLKATYPDPDAPVSGDITTWVGKNAKGKWRLVVSDWVDNGGGNDGAINSWSVNIQYLSSTKIVLKGDLVADGKILTDGGKSNCFVKDIGDGFSAVFCDGVAISGYKKPENPLMKRIFAGGNRSCGILLDDTGWCWGEGNIGQLNDTYLKFALHENAACGLKTSGSIQCWEGGSPPNGTYIDIACAYDACCAVATDNSMSCWGNSGDSKTTPPLGNYSSVDSGRAHFCAVTTAGDVKCWGKNYSGQTTVPQTNDIYVQVSLGNYHSCALRASDGYARCWGRYNNTDKNNTSQNQYNAYSSSGPYTKLAKGEEWYHCGLLNGGIFYCWGHNGNFWNLLNTNENTKRQAREDKGPYIDVQTSSSSHTCAIRRDLTPVCWGDSNSENKLILPKL